MPDAQRFSALVEGRRIGAFQIGTAAAVLGVLFIDGIDIQLLGLVAPLVIADWGVTSSDFAPALAAALIGMAIGAGMGGAIGDRIGRRTTLILATALFGTTTALAGLSDTVAGMAAMRLISGIGFGAAGPNGLALVSDWLPSRVRAQVASLMSIGTPAGGMLAAALIAVLLPVHGWRVAFIGFGALTIALAGMLLLFLRESPIFLLAGGKADAAVRAAGRVAAVTALLPEDDAPGSRQKGEAILGRAMWRLSLGCGLAFFAAGLISYAFAAWTTVLLSRAGFTMVQALSASFAFNVAAVIAATVTGWMVRSFGSRIVLIGSGLGMVAAILWLAATLATLDAQPSSSQMIGVDLLVGSVGGLAGVAMATIYAIMAFGYPAASRAAGIGFGMMLGRGGGICATLVGGSLLDSSSTLLFALLSIGAIAVIAGASLVDRHVPRAGALG